jgi:hypothetical protein
MKHLIDLAVILLVTTSTCVAQAGGQEIRECKFDAKAGCVYGEARVTLANGVVKGVWVFAFWCGLPGKPGYSCTIDSSPGDPDSVWSQDQGATLIVNASPFNPNEADRVKVTVGRYVSIDLEEAQSAGRCGTAAELPRAIVIPAQRGACRVWFQKY